MLEQPEISVIPRKTAALRCITITLLRLFRRSVRRNLDRPRLDARARRVLVDPPVSHIDSDPEAISHFPGGFLDRGVRVCLCHCHLFSGEIDAIAVASNVLRSAESALRGPGCFEKEVADNPR